MTTHVRLHLCRLLVFYTPKLLTYSLRGMMYDLLRLGLATATDAAAWRALMRAPTRFRAVSLRLGCPPPNDARMRPRQLANARVANAPTLANAR